MLYLFLTGWLTSNHDGTKAVCKWCNKELTAKKSVVQNHSETFRHRRRKPGNQIYPDFSSFKKSQVEIRKSLVAKKKFPKIQNDNMVDITNKIYNASTFKKTKSPQFINNTSGYHKSNKKQSSNSFYDKVPEKLLGKRVYNSKTLYKVKWSHKSKSESTWELELKIPTYLVTEFNEEMKKQMEKKRSTGKIVSPCDIIDLTSDDLAIDAVEPSTTVTAKDIGQKDTTETAGQGKVVEVEEKVTNVPPVESRKEVGTLSYKPMKKPPTNEVEKVDFDTFILEQKKIIEANQGE